MSAALIQKLEAAWRVRPALSFGALVEQVEDEAWDALERVQQRHYSRRLMHLPDDWFMRGIDAWMDKALT